MGIPHLYSFVRKHIPNSISNIDIIQEIDDWIEHNNEQPMIVIDFKSFSSAVCNDPLDDFFGCRSLHCYMKTENFFTKIQNRGVKIVFFNDGPAQLDKSEKIIERHNKKFHRIFKTLDQLYECNLFNELFEKYEINHRGSVSDGIEVIARKFGDFYKSYHNECDKELVAYATKNNAMAVISDDTDYLIFNGNWSYWSDRHINFSRLTTIKYNKTTIHRYFGLTQNEMPLLATLAGNDIISIDRLEHFHRFLGNPRDKFHNISRYIIQNFRNLKGYKPDFIAHKVFGSTNKSHEYTELVINSLNFYNIRLLATVNENDNNIDLLSRIKVVQNDCYAYLLDLARNCSISYFDVRTPQFEKYPELTLELIRRQLGIILQHKNNKTLTRHIYCYKDGRYVFETLHPTYPPISVPALDDLYSASKTDIIKMVKIELLAWVLSDRLDFNNIKGIDKKYFCTSLTLYYMVQNKFISVQEADIFLHTTETIHENSSTIIDLPLIDRIDPRAFQIVFLYDLLYKQIRHAISNCGLFELNEHIHMDGLYFHFAYNKMDDLANTVRTTPHLKHLRLYAMDDIE